MRFKTVILFLCLGGLLSCGPGSPKVEIPLILNATGGGEALQILGINGPGLPTLSTRVIWTQRGQAVAGKTAYKISPFEARPPTELIGVQGNPNVELVTDWNLAVGEGVPWDPFNPTVMFSGLPVNVEGLKFAIEFLFTVVEGDIYRTYVVAYACVEFTDTQMVSLSTLKATIAQGVNVYSGRTCGRCPRLEDGGAAEDDVRFNYADLSSIPAIIPVDECPPSP